VYLGFILIVFIPENPNKINELGQNESHRNLQQDKSAITAHLTICNMEGISINF